MSGYGGGPVTVPASATAARALISSAATGAGEPAGRLGRGGPGGLPWPAWRDGQAGQGALPGGDALAGQHAEPERERLRACVQGGMTQLLVAGIQPAAGGTDLAGIRACARFSSRVAR